MAVASAVPSTRVRSPEGILKSGAVLTRAGEFEYTKSELGLEGSGLVKVNRTMDTLRHPTTLESLRDAPITIDHPPDGVTDENFREVVVGYVAGTPQIVDNIVVGDVIIGDRRAQLALDAGAKELSPGYDFETNESNDATVGPMRVNHLALVEKGRSGPGVRVLDRKPKIEEPEMDPKEIKQVVADGVTAGLAAALEGKKAKGLDSAELGKSIVDGLKPTLDTIVENQNKQQQAQDAATKKANDKKAEDDAKAAADALVKQTQDEMTARFQVMQDVLPLVDEKDRAALIADGDVKAILVKAVGDAVPNADSMSEDFLRGVALGLRRQQDANAGMPLDPSVGGTPLPSGVVPFKPGKDSAPSGDRKTAYDAYVEAASKKYKAAGGV